jgi:two-component system sensor histidine kinase KdpD
LIAFARSRNVGRIVVGKTERPRWKEVLFGSFIDNLIRESGEIDVYVVRGDEAATVMSRSTRSGADSRTGAPKPAARVVGELTASAGAVAASVLLGLALYRPPDLSEESLILLAGVVVSALWFGRFAATLASILSVLAFNYFFTEPRFSLNVNDSGYLITFAVMLTVGVVVGSLAARAREQQLRAWTRERATAAQHALARELSAAGDVRAVAAIVARHAHDLLQADAVLCTPIAPPGAGPAAKAKGLEVAAAAGQHGPDWYAGEAEDAARERGVARWAFDHGSTAGRGTSTLPSAQGRYVPLVGSRGRVGVLGVRAVASSGVVAVDAAQLGTLGSIASQAASALERVMLAEAEQVARITAERERLRSVLLSSVSHDLRTPLLPASPARQARSSRRALGQPLQSDRRRRSTSVTRAALLRTIVDESSRLNDIIANLVFATRLESGSVELRREWTTVLEVVGCGAGTSPRCAMRARPFQGAHVPSQIFRCCVSTTPCFRKSSTTLLRTRCVTHRRARHSEMSSWTSEMCVVVKVWDEGAGLSDDESSKVFERFYRGRASKTGTPQVHQSGDASDGNGTRSDDL